MSDVEFGRGPWSVEIFRSAEEGKEILLWTAGEVVGLSPVEALKLAAALKVAADMVEGDRG